MHWQTDKCVYYLHTLFCLTCLCLSPPSCSLIFPFHGRTQGGEEEQSLREGWLFKGGLKRGRRHQQVSQLPSIRPPSSQSQVLVYLGMFLLSGSSLPLVWTRYNTKRSQTLRRGGSSAPPIFPIHQPRQNYSRAPVCCQTEGSTADCNLAGVLMMEGNYFWLFVVVLWPSRKTTNVVWAWVV